MQSRSVASNLGIYVYAAAAMFLGLVGLVSGDFAVGWQHVGPSVPLREPLAYAIALIELAAGVALVVPSTARVGAVALTIVYAVFTLLWVPKALIDIFKPDYDAMGNAFEEFSMVAAGLVLCAILSAGGSAIAGKERLFARIFGLCPVSFGIVHIFDRMAGIASWVPKWLQPGPLFWAYTTTICFFLAAVAILTGIAAPLAARLLTVEIVGFQLLVWIPKLAAGPRQHFNWAGNGINLAIAASAWVVADSIRLRAKRKADAGEIDGGGGERGVRRGRGQFEESASLSPELRTLIRRNTGIISGSGLHSRDGIPFLLGLPTRGTPRVILPR